MRKVTIFNNGNCALPVNGTLLAIGSQMLVDASDVTPGIKKFAVKDDATEKTMKQKPVLSLVEEIQALPVKKALARFDELDNDQLNNLSELESSQEKPRSGIVDGVVNTILQRSRQADENDDVATEGAASE
jgi:hypothetical protein